MKTTRPAWRGSVQDKDDPLLSTTSEMLIWNTTLGMLLSEALPWWAATE